MNTATVVIQVHEISKRFGSFTAVDGLNFEVYRGEIFGFLGPNGSGKTTTIRMMLGLMKPNTGAITILGMNVNGDTRRIRPRVGYMSQRFSLYNDLTVLQNLNFYGTAYGLSGADLRRQVDAALESAGLGDQRQARTRDLAGGWRQRLALSAATLHNPEILFLDEPTAGVDPVSRRVFWDLLYQLTARGVTIFVTTHYMDEAEHCQRLAFIHRGSLMAIGTPAAIKREKMPDPILELFPADAAEAVRVLRAAQDAGRLAVQEIELYGALVHVVGGAGAGQQAADQRAAVTAVLGEAGIAVDQMDLVDPSLEDVFIACTKD